MKRQPDIDFTSLLAKWPDTAIQTILNRRRDASTLTVLYERLSQEDEYAAESNSIRNQKAMLEDYALKNNLPNIIHLTDDGISGTRFDRPDFMKMMELAEAGCVGTLIVKDLSRFGRDHLRVGLYTERLRECGVRFIALLDNVDTARGEDDFTPFRNIINEWAARDSSRKAKAVFRAKGMEGKPLTSHCLYGYRKDPSDKHKWIIDEEAAAVVRRIYQMCVEGVGPWQIAHKLSDDKVERPSYYHGKQGLGHLHSTYDAANPYSWCGSTVVSILKKPEYKGCLANFKTHKASYKDKQRKPAPRDEWMFFEGALEPIVEAETWELAQRLRKTRRRTDTIGEANPLTGLLYCADCGEKMWNRRNYDPKAFRQIGGKYYKRSPQDMYDCSTFKRYQAKFVKRCSQHYIRTSVVRELVLEAIRSTCAFVKENEDAFVRIVREASRVQQEETAKAWKKRLAMAEKRITELDALIRQIYEDKVKGSLTEKRFAILCRDYEAEQEALEAECAGLRADIERHANDSVRADKFIDLVKKYTDFTELTTPMLHEFIDKIVVHEADKSSGERRQNVDIYLSYIGMFEVPEANDGLTEAEREAMRIAEEKRARHRVYNRKSYAKRRRENEQAREA